jgi:hypothetical protein
MNVLVKDRENMAITDVEEFETVFILDLPPSVDKYAEILTGVARHTVTGKVHSIFCNAYAPLAKPLVELLANCGHVVPDFLKKKSPCSRISAAVVTRISAATHHPFNFLSPRVFDIFLLFRHVFLIYHHNDDMISES